MYNGILPSGVSIHDVLVWADGLGWADRKSTAVFSQTSTTLGDLAHGGQWLVFDGGSSRVAVGSNNYGDGDITIFAWINAVGTGENAVGRITENGKLALRIDTDRKINFERDYSGGTYAQSAAIDLDTDYFVAVTSSGTTANIYLNGVLSGDADQTTSAPTPGLIETRIGNSAVPNSTWNGKITQVIAFSKILTPEQIGQFYNRTK